MAPRGLGDCFAAATGRQKENAIIPRPRDRYPPADSRRPLRPRGIHAGDGKAGLFMPGPLCRIIRGVTPEPVPLLALAVGTAFRGPNRSIASPPRCLNIATALHAEAMGAVYARGEPHRIRGALSSIFDRQAFESLREDFRLSYSLDAALSPKSGIGGVRLDPHLSSPFQGEGLCCASGDEIKAR